MRSVSRRWTGLLGGALALASAGSVHGQASEQRIQSGGVAIRPGGLGSAGETLDSTAFSDLGGAGTSDSSVVRDAFTAQETFFRTFDNGIIRIPKLGYGLGKVSASIPLGASAGFSPFRIESRPDAAEFKFGNFYLDIISLGGSILYSDNSQLTEADQERDATASVRLEAAAMYQINDAMQLTVGGAVNWLPFKSEVTLSNPTEAYTGTFAPVFQSQFSYDIPFNKIDVQILDSFSAQSGGIGTTGRAFDLLDRRREGLNDPAFRDTQAQGATDRRSATTLAYRNNAGINVSTVLPTVTRLTFGYLHDNIWQTGPGQETSSDSFTANLASERENLRFKPFFSYRALHQNNKFGYDTSSRGGFEGPVTDNVYVNAEMGYFLAGDEAGEGYTWIVSLVHRPRESIEHQLDYGRTVTYPDRSFGTSIGYSARVRASQDITLELAAQEVNVEPLDNPNNSFGGKQFRTEGRVLYRFGRRVTSQFGHAWLHASGRGPTTVRFDQHTFRFAIVTEHTPKLQSTLLLQNETRDSNIALDSYTENVISLSVSRNF